MKRKPRGERPPDGGAAGPAPAPSPLWFVARFVAWIVVGQVAVAWFPPFEAWAVRNTMDTLRVLAGWMGAHGAVQGNTFQLGPSRIQIVGECTPLMPTLVLAAAIVAYPTARRAQVLGILGGGLVIWAFNLFRIGTLMAVIAWWPASFDFIHMYLWQTISLLVVLLVFLSWLRLFRERPEPR